MYLQFLIQIGHPHSSNLIENTISENTVVTTIIAIKPVFFVVK